MYKRPYRVTPDSAHAHPIADNVLDGRFDGWQPTQAWVGDITYIATAEGWLYLAAILDLARRRVEGWSMSRKGNCWDNAPMESFFKALKVERVYQTRYETRAEARLDIVDWIKGFYDRQRLHSSIDYQMPINAEHSPVAA